MMELELNGQRYPVPAGETVVGAGPEAALRLEGPDVQARHLVVRTLPDGTVAVRRGAPEAETLVNGVRLGEDPTVLLHGDKLVVGPHELVAVDAERAGSTRVMDASKLASVTPLPRSGAARVIGTTNGRLVCLTDGREYAIGEALVFGRDAACDVVVTGGDVSRQHAEIRRTPAGYELRDLSANGTIVNGERLAEPRLLARADVLRIGADEFRFYADAPAAEPVPAEPLVPPPGAAHRLNDTLMGIPVSELMGMAQAEAAAAAAPAAPVRPAGPIASLLVRSGALKGERLPIRNAVANIGRADYNDVVLPEPSVSASHAKLQRRDDVWILSDLGSTNGTTVDGMPVAEEPVALGPGSTLKFGEVSVLFEPLDRAEPRAGATQVMGRPGLAAPAAAVPAARADERGAGARGAEERPEVIERIRPPTIVPAPQGGGRGLLVAAIVLVVIGVVVFLLMRS